jgi:Uma2 family endonuclease
MAHATNALPKSWTIADLLEHFGHIPPARIRLHPAPGTATERDVRALQAKEDRLYELVDGVLVEKAMGIRESCLAAVIIRLLGDFVDRLDLGLVTAPDGTLRLAPGLVRIPDVAFVSWQRLPSRHYPDEPIPDLVPDLAVEVLSEGNTAAEIARKIREYFFAGVRLVWIIDPANRSVLVYTAPDQVVRLDERQTLEGGEILPGFRLPLTQLFARLSRRGNGGRKERPGQRRRKQS